MSLETLAQVLITSDYSHGPHVVLRQQWDLQHLGVVVQGLVARGGHRLARDAVDLVEGVRPQQPVVSRADEQLQGQRLALHVARGATRRQRGDKNTVMVKPSLCFLSKTKRKVCRSSGSP